MFNANTKFLIVDDLSTARIIVKKVLADLGFNNIVEAIDGKNALDVLHDLQSKNTPVDFIISDWSMPHMPGIDLLIACRRHDKFKNIPFMLVTTESEQSQIIEAANAGVSEYVIKPFNSAIFKNKIERVYKKIQQKIGSETENKVG